MEPASGEPGMCWVRDDKSRPSGQAESANTHLHLIHQPSLAREPLLPQGKGLASRSPFGSDGRELGDLSCQQFTQRPMRQIMRVPFDPTK